jgi:hypothetical protein
VNSLPKPRAFIDAEMIRDGGSLSMTFEDQHQQLFILFVKIVMPSLKSDDIKVLQRAASYEPPVLIDPAKRPPDTETVRYSELAGEASELSWEEASGLMKVVAPWVSKLSTLRLDWFNKLNDVIGRQGRPSSP